MIYLYIYLIGIFITSNVHSYINSDKYNYSLEESLVTGIFWPILLSMVPFGCLGAIVSDLTKKNK